MPNKKFTDHDLVLFYRLFLANYHECKTRYEPGNLTGLYNEMHYVLSESLYNSEVRSPYYFLDEQEKQKVYSAFNTFFEALTPPALYASFSPDIAQSMPQQRVYVYKYIYTNDSLMFDWLALSILMNDCNRHHYSRPHSSHYHGHPLNNPVDSSDKNDYSKFLAIIALLLIAAAAAVMTYIAFYYMLVHFLDGADRFYHNEGWLKTSLMLASSISFGVASSIIGSVFATTPLMSLAFLAGLNPVVLIVFSTLSLSIIGAGLGAFAMNTAYEKLTKTSSAHAIDPTDPLRFRLTPEDEERLRNKQIDPIKVKCALVILRSEMAKLSGSNKNLPTFLTRPKEQRTLLQQVRELRAGTLKKMQVGDMSIDCSDAKPPSYDEACSQFDRYREFPEPSAPPLYY